MFLNYPPEDLRRLAVNEADERRFHLAEHYAGQLLDTHPDDATALNVMGRTAMHARRYAAAVRFFKRAAAANPSFKIARKNLAAAEAALAAHRPSRGPRYLLIRDWGAGFWADVDHVLGQLLVAEITGRVPLVHWGPGSRFGDGTEADNWTRYFAPVSSATLADLEPFRLSGACHPEKWKSVPWTGRVPNRWVGPGSRPSNLDNLASDAPVVIGDFFYSVGCGRTWLEPDHPASGLSVAQIYRWLIAKYLRPTPEIVAAVDAFATANFTGGPVMAIHIRGTDKHTETKPFGDLSAQYPALLDAMSARHPVNRMFLMTDEAGIAEYFRRTFGERVVMTDAFRGSGSRGIHFDESLGGPRLGREVLIDTLLAARADCFVGFGPSNVTGMILVLKDWPPGTTAHVGPNYLDWRKPGAYFCPPVSER